MSMRMRVRASVAAAAGTAAVAWLLAGSAPAGAASGGGLHGPVVTHPEMTPRDNPAGDVCAFDMHTEFPVADLTLRTWTNDAGDPVYAIESGPLVARVTNTETGRTVERDISGTGTHTYPDKHTDILSGSDWAGVLHKGDKPANKLLISRGFMSVKITTEGDRTHRELLALDGKYEDLCETLG
ncbi:hypothetical protein [Streptomyces iconiensis]|uniref:Secreted protein n=1 Tax=Streptomyces iconiensis TaxID=1384038 RepID=A0ABT7A3V0_9ACTN|nr:hypothetical protein [Streptomyces iconiensis]MDJ1136022.1 hypothetical protein [Streptomyces iconiensis]